jgi:hypothetical protein
MAAALMSRPHARARALEGGRAAPSMSRSKTASRTRASTRDSDGRCAMFPGALRRTDVVRRRAGAKAAGLAPWREKVGSPARAGRGGKWRSRSGSLDLGVGGEVASSREEDFCQSQVSDASTSARCTRRVSAVSDTYTHARLVRAAANLWSRYELTRVLRLDPRVPTHTSLRDKKYTTQLKEYHH